MANAIVPYDKLSKKSKSEVNKKHRNITPMNTGTRDIDIPFKQKRQSSPLIEEERLYDEKGEFI